MRTHRVMVMMLAALLVCGMMAAMAQGTDRPAQRPKAPELTAEQKALLDDVQELRKQIRIAELELALLEVKDAPEGQIAAKAEDLYRVRGQMYALRAKHPELAGRLHGQRMRHAWGRGRGLGLGHGGDQPGMGRHRGGGMGRGMGRGMGPGMGPGMGGGMGRGRRDGSGRGMGEGLGLRGPGAGRGVGNGQGLGLEEQGMDLGMGPEMGPGRGMGMRMRERAWHGLEERPSVPDANASGEDDLED